MKKNARRTANSSEPAPLSASTRRATPLELGVAMASVSEPGETRDAQSESLLPETSPIWKSPPPQNSLFEELSHKLVPLRGVAVLGSGQAFGHNIDLKPSALLMPEPIQTRFEDLPYENWDAAVIRNRLRRHYSELRRAETVGIAMPILRQIGTLWSDFYDQLHLARVRRLEMGEYKEFYEAEYARAIQAAPILEKTILKITASVLDKNCLDDFSSIVGKLALLRINSQFTLMQLGGQDLRASEQAACKNLIATIQAYPKTDTIGKTLRQADIHLDDLLRKRREVADKLGFASFRAYAWALQDYFDYSIESLRDLRSEIKRYLLPIHLHQVLTLQKLLPPPGEISSQPKNLQKNSQAREPQTQQTRSIGSRLDYYERFFGEEDWELRHLNDFAHEGSEFVPDPLSYPSSRLYALDLQPQQFFDHITAVIDASLPRQNRGFLQELGQMGYIRLYFRKPPEALSVVALDSGTRPLMSGTYHQSTHFSSEFLQMAGEMYAHLLSGQGGRDHLASVLPAGESRSLWGLGMEVMCLPHMHMLYGEEGADYAKEKIDRLLRGLLLACLIDEFEETIYRLDEISMSDRQDLWLHLRESYGMELYTEEKFWADDQVASALLRNPFGSLIRALPTISALSLWDLNRKNKKKARADYESFCSLGSSDTFLQQLAQVHLPDPLAKETIKRLAYQIASYLES
ncbi:MAG: hypothetical protein EOM12_06515 [Verrucomicrobiae bacterium]|nr:hypothetical protein [Verrucomicrobiae bacterium]